MQDTVNIGIVGLGFGVTVHMPCLEKNARAKVVAVCARNRERAQAVADENSVAGVYTDYSSMLRNADLDAVVIATPDDLHREMVIAADFRKVVACTSSVMLRGHALFGASVVLRFARVEHNV